MKVDSGFEKFNHNIYVEDESVENLYSLSLSL